MASADSVHIMVCRVFRPIGRGDESMTKRDARKLGYERGLSIGEYLADTHADYDAYVEECGEAEENARL